MKLLENELKQPHVLSLRDLASAFFFYAVACIQIEFEVTENLFEELTEMCPFKGQKIFVLLSKFANSHNGRIVRPNGGMEWGKLAAAPSAPSVLGKNRSREMCFPVS